MSAPKRLSGLQKDVLALYRSTLREATKKDRQLHLQDTAVSSFPFLLQSETTTCHYARSEFRKQAQSVKRSDFRTIEYMIRKGEKHLKLLKMPGTKVVQGRWKEEEATVIRHGYRVDHSRWCQKLQWMFDNSILLLRINRWRPSFCDTQGCENGYFCFGDEGAVAGSISAVFLLQVAYNIMTSRKYFCWYWSMTEHCSPKLTFEAKHPTTYCGGRAMFENVSLRKLTNIFYLKADYADADTSIGKFWIVKMYQVPNDRRRTGGIEG